VKSFSFFLLGLNIQHLKDLMISAAVSPAVGPGHLHRLEPAALSRLLLHLFHHEKGLPLSADPKLI
jgi:hypothetical protein